jgi:hypothetical protein
MPPGRIDRVGGVTLLNQPPDTEKPRTEQYSVQVKYKASTEGHTDPPDVQEACTDDRDYAYACEPEEMYAETYPLYPGNGHTYAGCGHPPSCEAFGVFKAFSSLSGLTNGVGDGLNGVSQAAGNGSKAVTGGISRFWSTGKAVGKKSYSLFGLGKKSS